MSTADDSLYWACFHDPKHRILRLANQNSVNYVHPPIGDTLLHQACKRGWLDIVEMLIEK
jgi:ankyrin repeat protein